MAKRIVDTTVLVAPAGDLWHGGGPLVIVADKEGRHAFARQSIL